MENTDNMSDNMNRINSAAITGPFADANLGDYAMLVNNIYDLNIKDIVLFSYDRKFLDVISNDYLQDYNISIIDVCLEDGLQELWKSGNHRATIAFELLSMVENYEELVRVIQGSDVLIVSGGGYLNGLWSMPHRIARLISIIAPILIARKLDKQIFFTSNSFGPFGEDSEFFTCLFGILDDVTLCCRDNLFSPMWLRQIGVDSSRTKYMPDDLFSINRGLLELETHNNIESERYIVLESYLPVDYFAENADSLKIFSKRIYEKHGLSIVFLPFHLEHGGVDQAEYLQTVLSHYEYLDIALKGYLPIQDAVEIIRNAELVVSSRYHALVLALSCGTPVVNVLKDVLGDKRYYYNKSSGMLREALKGTAFDERLYLGSDYLEALTSIAEGYDTIIAEQAKIYDDLYVLNKERLTSIRLDRLSEIAGER